MTLQTHQTGTATFTEVRSPDVILNSTQDALDLMATVPTPSIAVYVHNVTPAFFDLKTGIAGEILQKFSNYRVRLAIIGNFSTYSSSSLQAFIYESNIHKNHLFVSSLDEVKKLWHQ